MKIILFILIRFLDGDYKNNARNKNSALIKMCLKSLFYEIIIDSYNSVIITNKVVIQVFYKQCEKQFYMLDEKFKCTFVETMFSLRHRFNRIYFRLK